MYLIGKTKTIFCRIYVPDGKINPNTMKHAINMASDVLYNGPINLMVETLSKYQPQISTYYYHYGHSASHSLCDKIVYSGWKFSTKLQLHNLGVGYNMRNSYGICHGDELLYQFILGNQPPPMNAGPLSDRDKEISQRLLKIWTQFALNADPNGENTYNFRWNPAILDENR